MTEELLAYLLDDLDPQRRAVVERRIEIDPVWRRELERLQQCLAAGGNRDQCGCSEEPPPTDLLARTCCLVERACQGPDESGGRAPATLDPLRSRPAEKGLSPEPCRGALARPWTLWDVSVGAGVLLALGALMTPALYETRTAARRLACDNNLKSLGAALFDYQARNGRQLPAIQPGESSAMFAVQLLESGLLSREQLHELLVCPDSRLAAERFAGRFVLYVPSRRELQQAVGQRRLELVKSMGGSYAFTVGYYDAGQQYRQTPYTGDAQRPLLADSPELTPQGVRSANHVGGQYVLNECLSPKFQTNCLQAGGLDNVFLNAAGRHAAGLETDDYVLIRPDHTPSGALLPVAE